VSVVSGNVLLTGATGGIGHSIARAFAAQGADLVLTGRRADVLEPLAAEVGGRALACDLGDGAAVDRLVAVAGAVDVLVANAALPASGPLLEYTQEQIDRALEVNLRAGDLRLSTDELVALDVASDPRPADYPYGELGREQRGRRIGG